MKTCPTCRASYPNDFAVCPRDGVPLLELGAWSEGTIIRGKYRVLSKVGQGGMGSVYKALHLAFDELRALKVMSSELLSDESFVRRFKQEAVITRKLQHPNAVRVDDIDEAEDGRPFIVMEFIEGRSLRKLIEGEGPLPVPRVCAIIKQVSAALDAAHGLGMVHRDIKPDNIVLIETPNGEQAKVLDFGVAKLKEARLGGAGGMTLTGTGVVVGTPQYMSPEQAMGKRGDELDGRSDIYSLGIVMYQMLTGELPFKTETTMEMLLAHMQRQPTPIHSLRPELDIPDSVASLVMKCLEKKRELRPASARTLVELIERAETELSRSLRETRVATADTLLSEARVGEAGRQDRPGASFPQPVAPPAVGVGRGRTPQPRPREPRPPAEPPETSEALRGVQVPVQVSRAPTQPLIVQAKPSRRGLWASLAIIAVALGFGAWFLASHRAPVQPPPGPGPGQVNPNRPPSFDTSGTSNPKSIPPGKTTEASGKTEGNSSQPAEKRIAPGPTESEAGGGEAREPAKVKVSAEAADKVKQAIVLGDFYVNRGEYDDAIRAYRNGLNYDPTNAVLRSRLDRAEKAKAAEGRVLE